MTRLAPLPIRIVLSFLSTLAIGCAPEICMDNADCPSDGQCIAGYCEPAPEPIELGTPECPIPTTGQIVLNEVLADPSGWDINGDTVADPFQDEFVEVYNRSAASLQLGGTIIRVGSANRYTFPAHCLKPNEAVVVFGGGLPAILPSESFVAEEALRLPNQGTTVALLSTDGLTVLDYLQYGKEADRPHSLTREPDGTGTWGSHPVLNNAQDVHHSAGRCVNGNSFPNCERVDPGDDRGLVDPPSCPPLTAGELRINEVLVDPGGEDTNGDGVAVWQQDEFVEIVLVAIGERRLDQISLQINGMLRATLPPGCHRGGSAFVYFGGGSPALQTVHSTHVQTSDKALMLTNDGATLTLVTDTGDVIDAMTYGAEAASDQALTRYPDGWGPFVLHTTTPYGATSSPGTCSNGEQLNSGCMDMRTRETPPVQSKASSGHDLRRVKLHAAIEHNAWDHPLVRKRGIFLGERVHLHRVDQHYNLQTPLFS